MSSIFLARYDGRCVECPAPIKAGEEIMRAAEPGTYVHVECPAPRYLSNAYDKPTRFEGTSTEDMGY